MRDTKLKPVISTCLATGKEDRYESISAAARAGFVNSCVTSCVRGLSGSHAGYKWRYESSEFVVPPARHVELAQLLNSGLSTREAAIKMGIGLGTARRMRIGLNNLGLI